MPRALRITPLPRGYPVAPIVRVRVKGRIRVRGIEETSLTSQESFAELTYASPNPGARSEPDCNTNISNHVCSSASFQDAAPYTECGKVTVQ